VLYQKDNFGEAQKYQLHPTFFPISYVLPGNFVLFTYKTMKTMKLSNNLLHAIMLGVGLGAVATSCEFLDQSEDIKPDVCEKDACDENCSHPKGDDIYYDCPACGMG
jgi:hypothetical protein